MQQIELMIAGVLTPVQIPGGMHEASGTGLDGTTRVDEGPQTGQSPEDHPGMHFVRDTSGNFIHATADELLVIARAAALKDAYRLTPTRI